MAEYIFIVGPHKSGTSLMRSMLDGHPQLEVIPIESHFFRYAGWPIIYPYKKQDGLTFNFDEFKIRAKNLINEYNTSTEFTSDVNLSGKFDLGVFEKQMEFNSSRLDEATLLKYFNAIKAALRLPPIDNNKFIVEKSIENLELAWAIKLLLPKAKFIHLVKNPYHNLVSIRKFKTLEGVYPSLQEILGCLKINYHFLELNQINIPDYLALRYEDIVLKQEESIAKICQFAGLENNAVLSNPTVMGKIWGGNSMTGRKLKSIDKSVLSYWQKEINPVEIYYINKFFGHILDKYNYEKIEANKSFYRINKNESLKTYIRNRVLRIFD